MPPSRFTGRTTANNSLEFHDRENCGPIKRQHRRYKRDVIRIRFSRVRIPRELRAGQRRWFSDIYGVRRVAARRKERRAHRVRSSRITRCRRWYNAHISLANVLSCPVKSLIAIEDRGSRGGFDATSRFVLRGWKRWRESEKFPPGSCSFLFGAAYPLARINLFGLRFNVRRYLPRGMLRT